MADGGEVLSVTTPGDENAESGAEEDVKRMVACVHDAGNGDAGGGEGRNKHDHSTPDFASLVEDV